MAKRKEKKLIATYGLYDGHTLQSVIDHLKEKGITDLSKVTISMDSTYGCSCGTDDYCYCDPSYSDIRVQWEI
jgi:hypothetical protein